MKTPILSLSTCSLRWLQASQALALTVASLLLCWPPSAARADTHRWDGTTSAFWNTGANWDTGIVPTDGDDLVFPAGPTRLATTNNTSTTRRFNSITISGANYALRGNSLTLSNGVTATYGAGSSASVELDLTLARSQEIECTTDNSILYVTGDLSLGAFTLTVNGSGNVLLGGVISGTGGVTKNGTGSSRLYGTSANTYSGTTRVNVGTLEFNKTSGVNAMAGDLIVGNNAGTDTLRWLQGAQLPSTTDVTVNDGAVLDLNNFSEALGALTLIGGEVQTGTGLLTLGGNVTAQPGAALTNYASISGRLSLGSVTRTFNVVGSSSSYDVLRVYASVSGTGGLIKTGEASLGLYSSNSFSGPTTLSEGWLSLMHSQALGSTASGTTVNSSSYGLIMAGSCQVGAETLTLDGPCFWSVGGWPGESHSWGGDVIMTGQSSFYVKADVSMTVLGRFSGAGGFTLWGGGLLILSGADGNTYTGDTIVDDGTLELGKTAGDAIRYGTLFIGDGRGGANADVVRLLADNQLYSTVPIVITNSGWLDLNGHDDIVGPLTFTAGRASSGASGLLRLGGNVTVNYTASGRPSLEGNVLLYANRTFDIANSSGSPDLDLLAVVSGSAGFTKTGAGALAVYGNNVFGGVVTVNDGLVYLYHDAALGLTAGGTVVNDGGVLVLANDRHVGVEPLTLNGNGDGIAGALASIGGSNSWAGTVTLAADSTLTVQTNRYLSLTGVVTGPGGFIKKQPGTLILSGATANTFAGNTIVNEGLLLLDKTPTDGALPGPGDLTIGDGLGGPEADVVRELRNSQIDASANITVNHSGLLDLNDHSEVVGGLRLYSGRIETGTGTLTLGGDVQATSVTNRPASIQGHLFVGSFTRTFNVQNGSWTPDVRIAAQVSGAADILVTGGGGLMLEASNAISGTITVADHALLWVAHAWACGSTNAGTVVSDAARLGFDGDVHVAAEALTMNSAFSTSALWVEDGSNSWAGPITLAQDTSVGFFSDHHPTLNLAGPVSGSGGLIKNSTGTLILSGASGNTYAGNTVVNAGTLLLAKTTGAAIRYGSLTIGDGTGGASADVVRYQANNQLWSAVPITVTSSGLLDLNGHSDGVGPLTFTGGRATSGPDGLLGLGSSVTATNGNGTLQGNVELAATRTFNTAEAAGANLDVQAHVTGNGGLTKTGPGQLYLSSSNSFRGTTTISQGSVYADDDFALGTTDGGTIVGAGAGLVLRTDRHVGGEPLTLNGPGLSTLGALASIYGSNSWDGPITLVTDALMTVLTNDFLNLSGAIIGPAGFSKDGAGTLILSGNNANTYEGATHVNAGTLELDNTAGNGAIPGALVIGDGMGGPLSDVVRNLRNIQIHGRAEVSLSASGLWELDGHIEMVHSLSGSGRLDLGGISGAFVVNADSPSSTRFDGIITGQGEVKKYGSGIWTLTGNNTYTGRTYVGAYAGTGALLVNGLQPASPVEVDDGGTLGGTGTVGPITLTGPITTTGGVLSPGLSPGTLTSSNVLLDSATDFVVELTSTGADQLNARGKVGLGSAGLVLSAPGLLPAEGQEFVIVNNDDTDAVTGTFAGMPEGALVPAGPRQFRITYTGGNGNDVVLIATNTAALRPALSLWRTSTNTLVVSWPQSDIAWLLHATTNLGASPISWTELPPPYPTNATDCVVTEPAPVGNKFFRLRKP